MLTEITTLLGVTSNQQSFWPPLDLFRNGHHFNGEWSAQNETWFQRQAQRILSGDTSALQPHKQWKVDFRRQGAADVPPDALIGMADHARSTMGALLSSYPDVWDSYRAVNPSLY